MAKRVQYSVTAPRGFYAAGVTCGIKESGYPDLALIASDRLCAAAGVFTRSRTQGAPIAVCRRHLRDGRAGAILINSGNANASTGQAGVRDARAMCRAVAEKMRACNQEALRAMRLDERDVLVGSTGIIGQPLPMDVIDTGIENLSGRLDRGAAADAEAARAILTTDLASKMAHRKCRIEGRTVHLGGIAKGSGMIAPNMGTMLAYITTDAAIEAGPLHELLTRACRASFNRISVDQHTSPSDMAIVLANGASAAPPIHGDSAAAETFGAALTEICRDLAEQIVRDGEGATRVFRVRVTGARSEREADRVGKAVIDSPLVKTAVHGADPNWGRIVTAAGYSGAAIQPARISLWIGREEKAICVYDRGSPVPLDRPTQRRLHRHMKVKEVLFTLDLGRGDVEVDWLGCDLSRQYIAINADYTT